MILGICGFGYSGSGAVLDLLKSYNDVQVFDKFEFSFIYKPDGIGDLENALVVSPSRYFTSDSAIRRFIHYMDRQRKKLNSATKGQFSCLYEKYLSEIVQVTWMGSTSVHAYQSSELEYFFVHKIIRRLRRIFEKHIHTINFPFPPDKKMYFSYMGEDFYTPTHDFVMGITNSISSSSDRLLVLDQPFAANNPTASFRFFDNPLAIIVNRDPRDVYLLAKTSIGMTARFIPCDSVEQFIKYYRGLMNSRKNLQDDRILEIQFEDLIYRNEETIFSIEQFLKLDCNSKNQKTAFDPKKSINNTQLFEKYPQFTEDILAIEKELGEYLYNFSLFDLRPDFSTSVF